MSQTYKIKAVKSGYREWFNDYGNFRSYAVQLEGNGEPVNINRKEDSPAPKVGDEIYGDINVDGKGQQFKSQRKPQTSEHSSSSSRESHDTQDSINRSVALNDAVIVFQGKGTETVVSDVLALADTFYGWLQHKPIQRPDSTDAWMQNQEPTKEETPDEQWPAEPPAGMFADEEWKS